MAYLNNRKKQRSERRELKSIFNMMNDFFPFEDCICDYESFLIPIQADFLNRIGTQKKIKTAFMRRWIDKSKLFQEYIPTDLEFCKIVSVIAYPDLSSSQIYVFYKKECYENFWKDRVSNGIWYNDNCFSLNAARKITDFPEMCYCENVESELGRKYVEHMWFYGDIIK